MPTFITQNLIVENGLSSNTFSSSTISGGTLYGDGSNLTNVLTGTTNIGTGLTLSSVVGGNTLELKTLTGDSLNKITTTLKGDSIEFGINEQNLSLWNLVVQGNKLLDGSVTWVSGLTFEVTDLSYIIDGIIYSASSTTIILPSGDTTYDRIDVIYADTGSTIGVLSGTPSNNPEKPLVDGDTQVEVTFVSVPANSTGASINDFVIYDENTGTGGGEWNFSAYGGQNAKFDPNFTGVTYSGSKSVRVTGFTGTSSSGFYLSASTPIDITQYSSLQFALRNINSLGTNSRLYIYLIGAGGVITSTYTQLIWNGASSFPSNITYSPTNTSSWQLISIPLYRFYATNNSVYGIIVRPYNATTTQNVNMYLDKFQFVGGAPVNPPTNAWFGIKGDASTIITPLTPNYTLTISGGTNIGSVVTSPNRVNINLDNNISLSSVSATTITGNTLYSNTTFTGGLSANTFSATTIGGSGNCVNDLYTYNIHSCSPLNINPNNEGNVYVGSANTLTVDLTNERVGIGTSTPQTKFMVDAGSSSNQYMYIKSTGVDCGVIIDSGEYPAFVMRSSGLTSFSLQGVGANTIIFRPTNSIEWRAGDTNNSMFGAANMSLAANSYSYYRHNVAFDSTGSIIPSANVHIRGIDSSSSNFGLKVQDSGGTNNLYIKNNGEAQFGSGFKILSGGIAASVTGSFPIYGGFGNSFETNYLGVSNDISIIGSINFNNSGFSKISSNGSYQIGYSASGHHYFSTGNVGISIANPSEKLEVSGRTKTTNFTMTSGATNDYILKSDSSGNASWSPLSGITGVVNKYTITTGFTSSVTQTITHNLNTKYVHCSIWDSTDQLITAQVVRNSGDINNAVDITISTSGTYDILITG